MGAVVFFTDASPQEFTESDTAGVWKTFAGVGVHINAGSFSQGIVIPTISGESRIFSIPDPAPLISSLRTKGADILAEWKRIRGEGRKSRAVERLLGACQIHPFLFLSHSTRTDIERLIADIYISKFLADRVVEKINIGGKFFFKIQTELGPVRLEENLMPSFIWMARSICFFVEKAAQVSPVDEALFVHDNLPFNRREHTAALQGILSIIYPKRIYFVTDASGFEFVPVDHLAGSMNAFISGKDHTAQQWVWKNGRPGNFYMTADEHDGKIIRFI